MNHETLQHLYVTKRKDLIRKHSKREALLSLYKIKGKNPKVKTAIIMLNKEIDSLKSQMHKLASIMERGKSRQGTFIKSNMKEMHKDFISERADFVPSASRPKLSIQDILIKQEQFPIRKQLPFVSTPIQQFVAEEEPIVEEPIVEEPIVEDMEIEESAFIPEDESSLEQFYEEYKMPIIATSAVLLAIFLKR